MTLYTQCESATSSQSSAADSSAATLHMSHPAACAIPDARRQICDLSERSCSDLIRFRLVTADCIPLFCANGDGHKLSRSRPRHRPSKIFVFQINALVATCSSTRKRVQQLASAVATAGDRDIELLLKGGWPNLSRLIVRKADVTLEGLLCIAETWPALSSISFLSVNIKPTAMQHLAHCACRGTKSWQGLESLMLADVKLSLPACLKLAVADWPSIKTTRLRKTGMSGPGLRSVVSASWTDTLESLDLSCNNMASEHFEQLFTGIHWRRLHCLNLTFNKIDEEAAAWLLQGQMPPLAVLNLRCCDIKAKGMQQLVKAEWLMLQDIHLSGNCCDAAAFTCLPESFWPYIQVHNLSDCQHQGDKHVEGCSLAIRRV